MSLTITDLLSEKRTSYTVLASDRDLGGEKLVQKKCKEVQLRKVLGH